jgi:hypothetical protein
VSAMAKPKAGGRKANLSPRVPAARKHPRPGKWVVEELPDGKKRRVWVHRNFATDAVVKALEAGGWKRPVSNAVKETIIEVTDFDELNSAAAEDAVMAAATHDVYEDMALHELNNDITHVVADYISDARYQLPPKKFRPGAKAFHKVLKVAAAKFPSAESALAEALNLKLEKIDHEDVPDIGLCRVVLRTLLEASEHIQADEAGSGADADRAKHLFGKGLARIYEERTGQRPT